MAGVLGLDPTRLFDLTFREFVSFSRGVQKKKDREENHFRRIAWILAKANEDPKQKLPPLSVFWSIPGLDESFIIDIDPEEMEKQLQKRLKAWIKNN